ncbi:MAG TPA: hypothetical protein VGM33_06570, partial [Baekduia sp.]
LVIGLGIHSHPVMIVAIISSGAVLGVANAMLSSMLMGLSTGDTAIAASGTNFVRFVGGAIAPFLAGKLAEHVSAASPLFVGSAAVGVGTMLIVVFRPLLATSTLVATADLTVSEAEARELELAG